MRISGRIIFAVLIIMMGCLINPQVRSVANFAENSASPFFQLKKNKNEKLRGPHVFKVVDDIKYGEHERNRLDLYVPEDGNNFPCVMWIHGGALKRGDKKDAVNVNVCEFLASLGFVVAAVNYRLSPPARFPDFNHDIAAAFSWLYQNIESYRGNHDQIFIMGASADAYLAASVALDSSYLVPHNISANNIAGAVLISGTYDLHFLQGSKRLGAQFGTSEEILQKGSPITFAGKNAPPLLLLYADDDLPGRDKMSHNFIDALEKAGHRSNEIHKIPNRTHRSLGSRFADEDDPAARYIWEFLNKYRN